MMQEDRLARRPSWMRPARVDHQAWTGFLFDAAQLTRDTALFVSLAGGAIVVLLALLGGL